MATWSAGERLDAVKLSTYAGDPLVRETNVGPFTTVETVLDTITVPVVAGRRYRVVWDGGLGSTVAGDVTRNRLREDALGGTQIQLRQTHCATAGQVFSSRMEAFYIADATEDKTFVATSARLSGTGTISATGVGAPVLFYVENA
jgi:hypothetical protein